MPESIADRNAPAAMPVRVAAPPTAEAPTAEAATREKLDELRVEFGRTIKNYFPTLFVLTIVIATSLVLLIAIGFAMGRTMDATVLAASVQVAFGMVLGFVCVYIGLMMTWVGIDAAYSVKGDVGAGSVALKSASPGLLFALGGMLLVAVSLHKRIEYQENAMNLIGTQTISPGAGDGAVAPLPPKNPPMTQGTSPAGFSPFTTDPQDSPPSAGASRTPNTGPDPTQDIP